jgi:hypothetical protein
MEQGRGQKDYESIVRNYHFKLQRLYASELCREAAPHPSESEERRLVHHRGCGDGAAIAITSWVRPEK